MTEEKDVVLCNSLAEFVFRIDEMRQNGWEFDPEMPPVVYGFSYEAGFKRPAKDNGKPSRAEILAKARAAKAAKKDVANG